ncbi:hypothetical protein ACGFNV_11100 [Streptomyces sp. NPDC048751]|uniref:hypothetical protein n=1 Tax=Streptomyces sp. NPDC048751 TaxID=3365591 RepID=UPI00371BF3F3
MPLHSSRFDDLIGPSAPLVRRHVIWALRKGNQEAIAAYDFSEYSDGHTWGTNRWRFCIGALKDKRALATLPDARPLRLSSTFMLSMGGTVLYPVCYANDATADVREMKVRSSRIRRELFSAYGQLAPQVQTALAISDGVEGPEWSIEEMPEEPDLLPDQPTMLLLAYASNRNAGLLSCHVGEAQLTPNGRVDWKWLESLPTADPGQSGQDGQSGAGPSPVGPPSSGGPRFDSADLYEIPMEDADSSAADSND